MHPVSILALIATIIACVAARTPLWSVTTGQAIVADQLGFVGYADGTGATGNFVAHALFQENGTVRWSQALGGNLTCGQMQLCQAHPDLVFFAASSGSVGSNGVGDVVVALRKTTGAIVWQRSVNLSGVLNPYVYSLAPIECTADAVIMGTASQQFAVHARSGALLWSVPFVSPLPTPATVLAGPTCRPAGSPNASNECVVFSSFDSGIVVADALTGDTLFNGFPPTGRGSNMGYVQLDKATGLFIFERSEWSQLFAYTAWGDLLWTHNSSQGKWSAVIDAKIFSSSPTESNNVTVYDALTLDRLWSWPDAARVFDLPPAPTPPAISFGKYGSSLVGTFTWMNYSSDSATDTIGGVDPFSGKLRWKVDQVPVGMQNNLNIVGVGKYVAAGAMYKHTTVVNTETTEVRVYPGYYLNYAFSVTEKVILLYDDNGPVAFEAF